MYRKDELKYRILVTVALVLLCGILMLLVLRFRDNRLAEFTYDKVEGGIKVMGYQGDPSSLEIPETIDGYTVVAIGQRAFTNFDRLTEAVLPKTVTEIGAEAFADCDALKEVEAPGVTVIREEAFQGCPKLRDVTFSSQLAVVEDRAFQGCGRLAALKAPATLIEIGTDAFAGCGNLYLNVTENKLAEQVALQYGISTDGSDTSDGLFLRLLGATLLLGGLVALVWYVLAKIKRSKQGRSPIADTGSADPDQNQNA